MKRDFEVQKRDEISEDKILEKLEDMIEESKVDGQNIEIDEFHRKSGTDTTACSKEKQDWEYVGWGRVKYGNPDSWHAHADYHQFYVYWKDESTLRVDISDHAYKLTN